MTLDIATQAEVDAKNKDAFPERPLSSDEQNKLDTLYAFTMTKAAFFADLFMGQLGVKITDVVWCAATDGRYIYLNPKKLFVYTLDEQCFVICHEVMHCVLRHPAMMAKFKRMDGVPTASGKLLPYKPEVLNEAMDYVINGMLIHAAKDPLIPGRKWKFNKDWLYDPMLSKIGEEAVIDVYEQLLKGATKQPPGNKPPPPGGRPGRPCDDGQPGPGRFDQVIEQPPEGKGGKTDTEEEIQWKVAVAGAADRAKGQGKLPESLVRFASEYVSPEIPWEDKIRSLLNRMTGSGDYDFERGERRLLCRDPDPIFFPTQSSYGCGTVVCGLDSSGSITKEIPFFLGGMVDIIQDLNPEQLIIMHCDAKVHRVDYLEDVADMKKTEALGIPGGGGTDFNPVFKKIKELGIEPAALVYFTDLEGSFPPKAPDYPVIWAATQDRKVPFGEKVHCKIKV